MKIFLLFSALLLMSCAAQKPANNADISKSEAEKAVKELDRETGMPDSLK